MEIKEISINLLNHYERNAKKHSQAQVDGVARSIERFGMVQPIVADIENNIIIGHCRALACAQLNMETVPVIYVENLTPEQVNALRLVDNKTNESEWDFELLSEELNDILDLDMTEFGFGVSFTNVKSEQRIRNNEEIEVGRFDDDEFSQVCPKCKFRF